MFVRFRCPKCRAGLKSPATRRGHVIDCPGCGQMLRIPGQKPIDAPGGDSLEETTDYVAFDEEASHEPPAEGEPELPRPKRKTKRKRTVEPGVLSILGGAAARWVIGVLISFAISSMFCCGMLGWAYMQGRFVDEIPIVPLSAAQFAQEYRDNPKVAARRYEEGEVEVEVTGVVQQVAADDVEGPHVVLTGAVDGKPPFVRGYIDPDDKAAAGRLRAMKVGDTVKFRGFCDGREGDYINLSEIVLLP